MARPFASCVWQAALTPFAFLPDGTLVAPWTDERLRLWPTDGTLAELLARADAALPRRLSADVRQQLTFTYD